MTDRGEAAILLYALPDVEFAIAAEVIDRLIAGEFHYGPWPRRDRRNMYRQTSEELLDGMAYMAYEVRRAELDDLDALRGCEGCP